MKQGSFAWVPGLLALLYSGSLTAQPAAAPAPAAAPVGACYPACREGFTCHRGQCVSLCNPPCPAGLECVEGRRCEPPVPGPRARPYEPPPPPRKEFEELGFAMLGFHWGFPSNLDWDGAPRDADTTLGFNLRADSPVAKYLLLGPMLQFGSWRPSGLGSHSYYVDLDLLVRLRVPITTKLFNYQLWLGMPLGVSIDYLRGVPDAELGIGWNIGVLGGGAVHFSPKVGLFAELGWAQHRFQHSRDGLSDLDLALRQPFTNLGLVFRN